MLIDAQGAPKLEIAGGVYREHCLHPRWTEVFGSGGRAASAAAALGARTNLSCYVDKEVGEVLTSRAALEGFTCTPVEIDDAPRFAYEHGLSSPRLFYGWQGHPAIHVQASCVLRFGMIEGDAVIAAEQAVYDPQNPFRPAHFDANGSSAGRLALVLNCREAEILSGRASTVQDQAEAIRERARAEVVIVKAGARGALVLHDGGTVEIPAFQSSRVWKIGSGDCFAANFAVRWMIQKKSAVESAELASRASAYYCETRGFADDAQLREFSPPPVILSERRQEGWMPTVYLAGPFFTLAQLWMVEQARTDLRAAGFHVFSPYHDVGLGPAADVVQADIDGLNKADIVFAIVDGYDPGTVFELGHARATGKPAICYSEVGSEESHKMLQGTGCILESDYVTAIYRTAWAASNL